MFRICFRAICGWDLKHHRPIYCFRCIDVPVLVQWPRFPWPPEFGHEIGDWIRGERINPVAAADLRILATIASLQQGIVDPEAKGLLHESLASAVARLDLPPEVSVQFNDHVIREHSLPKELELHVGETSCG